MIAITSLSPNHKNFDLQQKAVDSWVKEGYHVVSLNSEEELEKLKFNNVEFVETKRHNKHLFGRPYVIASALLDFFRTTTHESCILINSDIHTYGGLREKLEQKSKEGVIIINRFDYEEGCNAYIFESGFDGFVVNRKFIDQIPQTHLCLGQCHWDYWIPWNTIQSNIPTFRLKTPYLYHKAHNTQYSSNDWKKTGEIFKKENKLEKYKDVGTMSYNVHRTILKKSQWLEL